MRKTKSKYQFDIWTVRLDPTIGSEQKGKRPCLLIQSNASISKSQTMLIAPFTSKKLDKIHLHELLVKPSAQNGLSELSKIKFDQIRVIDNKRLIKKLGSLEKEYLENVMFTLITVFDMRGDYN